MATERVWVVDTDPVTGEVNRQQAHELLSALEGSLYAIGGVMRVAADREPVRDLGGGKQEYRTVRYVFTWDSFAPARRPQPVEEPEELQEAEAAEAA